MIDKNIINKIIDNVKATDKDLIIEIGPGKGYLTKELVKKSHVIAIEIDEDMSADLSTIDNCDIIYGDFLKVDLKEITKNYNYEKIYLIANIPYYITTPIVKKIIEENIEYAEIILMVQKEMADRFSAKPKTSEYNSLTVFLNYYFNIETLFLVNKTSFDPIPKVDSAVVKFSNKQNKLEIKDFKFFGTLVKTSFLHKRKTIKNNLNNYNLEVIKEILEKNNLSLSCRAEEIPLDVFVLLANTLFVKK